MRFQFEEATQRCNWLRHDRDEAAKQLVARQREGAHLGQQWADARNEVLELRSQVRAATGAPPHGLRPPPAAAALKGSRAPVGGTGGLRPPARAATDPRAVDCELSTLRVRCATLEQEAARMLKALERGQNACERSRRRALNQSLDQSALCSLATSPAPFVADSSRASYRPGSAPQGNKLEHAPSDVVPFSLGPPLAAAASAS